MSALSLSLLGPFQASLDGRPLDRFRTNKVQALLIYLAIEKVTHRREALMALLWPGLPTKSAQVNLRQTLYQLRRTIPHVTATDGEKAPLLLSNRQCVQLNPAADVLLDVARFCQLLSHRPTPSQMTEAVALYRGDFLCDFYLPDSSEFEDWAATRRAEFQRQALDALETLVDYHTGLGEHDQAQTYAWRALEIDDLREGAYRGLMKALALDGQRGAALALYQRCQKRLLRELGVEPSAETVALYEQIHADALRETRERQPQPVPPRTGMPVFLFTDIEGSTPLWETHREAMLPALLAHNRILEEQIAAHGGRILELRGDGVKAVFEGVDPLPCVLAIQLAFGQHDWGAIGEMRVRIGLHGTPPEEEGHAYFLRGDQYYGPALHHAARVMGAGHGGQILVSEQVRNRFPLPPGARWQDFGVHTLKGLEEAQAIYGLLHPDLPLQEFPSLRTLSVEVKPPEPLPAAPPVELPISRHNLPPQPTAFIGREDELANLDRLISDSDGRLVTILGPGGIGKTRLALAAAERQLDATRTTDAGLEPRFPNGVFFVPLAALSSTNQIVPSVAEALDFRLRGGEDEPRTPEQQVLDYLREKRLLVVLDNLEHLLTPPSVPPGGVEEWGRSGASLVADILRTAPEVQILATSRERLHLHEEQVFPIQGLEFPDWERPEDTADYSAAQLFVQSARRIQPDFELTSDDLTYLARICRLLEGMPLGLELAAGWVDVLSLADISDEIQRNLDFLETEWRDVPARHRSVRAVFDASWHRLTQTERDAFTQLCVFRGGFTRAAAREVAGVNLRNLARLVDKSLLQLNRARDRYEMHELLRQYGADRLTAAPDFEVAARDRHSAYYCAALGVWEADIKGARQLTALAEIEADLENVRAAWTWAVAHNQLDRLDEAVDGLGLFCFYRGRSKEGETAFQPVADTLVQEQMTIDTYDALRAQDLQRVLARVLMWRHQFSRILGHWELVNKLKDQAQTLLNSPVFSKQQPVVSPTKDTRVERAHLLRLLGLSVEPDWDAARQYLEESLSLYQAVGDQWNAAWNVFGLGQVYQSLGDDEQARRMLKESQASFRALGCLSGVGEALIALGWWARQRCDYKQAQGYFQESLALAQAEGDQIFIGTALAHLGFLALFQGHFEAAVDYLQKSIAVSREMGNRGQVALWLSQLAAAFWFSGEFGQAFATIGESITMARELGTPWPLCGVTVYHAWLDLLAGNYAEARAQAQSSWPTEPDPRSQVRLVHGLLGWAMLAEERYAEAEKELQKSIAAQRAYADREYEAWSLVGLGRVELGLGNRAQARRHLLEALDIVVEIRSFIPLLHLMPVIPVALVDEDGPSLTERAVELYALAESHPFVASGQLFEDIAGRYVKAKATAALSPEVVEAAQARGQALDWWETAVGLLEELRELGWDERSSVPAIPSNLPPQPTPFIGREEELANLDRLIADPDVRLVTIAGPGGMGKTRLALAAAERQLEATEDGAPRFPQGVFCVPLAALSSATQIVPSVADALNFRMRGGEEEPRTPEQQVLDYLREKRMLLVLDNLEHLLSPPSVPPGGVEEWGRSGASLIADILRAAPEVQILVTSRERLHLHEEQAYPIQGLQYPDWERPDDTAEYTAAQLFLGSARRIEPGFELSGDDLTYLARICRLLEGMPLGLELAAGWVDVLSLADISDEIQRNLDFLETEWRDVPARHRSMRAVFDASWHRLSAEEQGAFTQLCVFHGGFTRAAAREVAGANLRTLAKLVNKSLLSYDKTQDRYEMHQLMRQYGAGRLAADLDAEAAVQDRHSAYYCTWLGEREAELHDVGQQGALAAIEPDLENAQAAFRWAVTHRKVTHIDRAMDGLCGFFELRMRYAEAEAISRMVAAQLTRLAPSEERGTAADAVRETQLRAKALAWQARFGLALGRLEAANQLLEKSRALLEDSVLADEKPTSPDKEPILADEEPVLSPSKDIQEIKVLTAIPNPVLVVLLFQALGTATFRRRVEQGLALCKTLGDGWHMADALYALGCLSLGSGGYEAAKLEFEQSLAGYESLGNTSGMINALNGLGWTARFLKAYDRARGLWEDSLALSQSENNLWRIVEALSNLGFLALFQGRFEEAAYWLEQSVARSQEAGHQYLRGLGLQQLGVTHYLAGRLAQASALFEQASAVFEDLGSDHQLIYTIASKSEANVLRGSYVKARTEAQAALSLASDVELAVHPPRSLAQRVLGWAALTEKRYPEAVGWLRQSVAAWRAGADRHSREWLAWSLAPLGLAAHGLGNRTEAQRYLFEALEIAVDMGAFIPLLHLMPIIPVVLAEEDELDLRERAVELYALAESHPYVANSQLFEDIAGRTIKAAAAALPSEVAQAVQARGRGLDWWETAEKLLIELRELGWGDG